MANFWDPATDHVTPFDKTKHDAMMTYIRDHSSEHITGGVDAIPVATTSKTGLCPIGDNDPNHVLNGQMAWIDAAGSVTNVTGTAPISVATGTTTPVVSISAATTGAAGSMSAADKTKLDGIEALADVTDATNVAAAGALMTTCTVATTLGTDDTTLPTSKAVKDVTDTLVTKALFDANTFLAATTDNTPAAVTVAEQTLVGRKTGGNIDDLSATEVRTILNVADGANAYVHPNHSGDVTSVADGAQTIADAAVTLAKMANLAQDKIIGRSTASTGVPEAIACTAQGRALIAGADASANRTTLELGTMATATATDYVAKADFGAQTVLIAITDDTPEALTIGEQTLLGRITGGDTTALTPAQVRTMLNVAEGAGTGTVTSVTATAPITSTEGTDPVIAISAASASAAGSMSADHFIKLEGIDTSANYTIITRQFGLDADTAILTDASPTSSETALTGYSFPLSKLTFTHAGKGTEIVYFKRHLDKAYAGGEFTGYLEFYIDAAVSDTVSHRLYGLLVDDGEAYDQELPLLATFTKGTNSAAAGTKYTSDAVTFTPTGTGNTLLLKLDRNSAGGVDTYTGDLQYISIYGTYPVA